MTYERITPSQAHRIKRDVLKKPLPGRPCAIELIVRFGIGRRVDFLGHVVSHSLDEGVAETLGTGKRSLKRLRIDRLTADVDVAQDDRISSWLPSRFDDGRVQVQDINRVIVGQAKVSK